ncbi:endoplasmic reticulum junction formation protein lunapark-B isoform X2 [Pectinophora gossypiella]|uniref:endoplasmic reticulum junction formation protein lunapark-B isoform X2 n=1 Tax=Pectinophora gossypiella TaxID=13191 RepID=UPI00214DF641|nr:endoplasmic reticulum junction formation protein lunapark-B isoform X2 [Pectinophora gossypiella]
MGLIISRFRRKKTTEEVLEKLETNIKSIEKDGQCKEQAHKRIVGYMMAYSVGLYVLFAVLYYYMYAGKSQHWLHSLLYASPLLVLPVLVMFLRSGITWYFNWSLEKNRVKLNKMKEEKKKILEEVMNTETYKVAKQILDKYGSPDEQSRALKPFVPSANVPATPGQIRQRMMQTSTPINNTNMNLVPMTPGLGYKGPRLRSEQLPRPLLDRNRSALDKVVDYLLKDGPNQRMALICTECSSHNGMALMEEFEYVSFHCAYCGKFHPARKQRPAAPALNTPARPALMPRLSLANAGGGDDSSIASSASDSEDEKKCRPNVGCSGGESDRSPSPVEGAPKSDMEKKED